MAKFTGDLASFSFAATTYQCLTTYSWNGTVEDAVATCSGSTEATTVRLPGATNDVFSFDVILDAQGTTELGALKRGSTGAFEFHPEGDSTSNIEFTATNAVITNSTLAGGTGALGVLSLTIGIDGALTIGAAA